MWRSKKFIIGVVLAAVLLVGGIGGVVLAQENGDSDQPKTLLDRVAEILVGQGINITSEQLEEACAQARSEMRDEALDKHLQKLVDEGTITSEQADQYKAWLQARPDMEPFREQMRDWEQAKPDMPIPGPFGRFGGHHFHGRIGHHFGGGPCVP